MHDVCAIVPYVEAGLIQYADARVDIELAGTHTRGMTVCDLLPAQYRAALGRPAANAQVAFEADSGRLVAKVIDTLLGYH